MVELEDLALGELMTIQQKRQGISNEGLAGCLGMSESTLDRIRRHETGELKLKYALSLGQFLGCDAGRVQKAYERGRCLRGRK